MEKPNENMIDEQDLFNYVFYPKSISIKKKELIKSDILFGEIISFYTKLRLNTENETDNSLKEKIANRIPAYRIANIIHFIELKLPVVIRQNGNRLAADSKELKPRMTTKSFVDNDKEYLIKILNYEEMTKVFVFSTKDEVVRNFDIIIEPGNLKYHFEDNSEPLIIDHSIDAEKIELLFN